MIVLKLFLSFLRIGLFAIGGAYSFLPLIEKEAVEKYQWLTREEFVDILGIVKIFPGAISIKYATYTGYKIAGLPGAIAANLGNLIAPVFLVFFATFFYSKYKDFAVAKNAFQMIQLAVFSMLMAVAFKLVNISQLTQVKNLFFIVICFVLFLLTKIHPALIIVGAGMLGAILN